MYYILNTYVFPSIVHPHKTVEDTSKLEQTADHWADGKSDIRNKWLGLLESSGSSFFVAITSYVYIVEQPNK